VLSIVPHPAHVVLTGEPPLVLHNSDTVSGPVAIVDRFVDDVQADGGPTLRRAEDAFISARLVDDDPSVAVIGLSPSGSDPAGERYHLRVHPGGVVIESPTDEGLHRGLTSLRQLIASNPDGLPCLEIDDAPRFAWRGLSLDVVRTFWPVSDVERVIDMLSLYRLNVLHLHLTDDQGWRIPVPGWPLLTTVGASGAMPDRPGGSYSVEELDHLVAYAAERFVTIVPEIDMPGHAAAAMRAYPALAADPTTSNLDPDHDGVSAFAEDALAALAAAAPGPFVHIGGDEAWGMAADPYGRFVRTAREIVRAHGKRPIGWQETSRAGLGPDDVVQHWLVLDPRLEGDLPADLPPHIVEMSRESPGDLIRARDADAWVLLSPAFHTYLDTRYRERPDDGPELDRRNRLGLPVYPRRTAAEFFEWDPDDEHGNGATKVAGIEAAMWCETIATREELEFMLLPRLPGVAAIAWSPPQSTTWEQHRAALAAHTNVWAAREWTWFAHALR